ncbi:MAG TPA: FABP family protein [Ilumatobacteraceae bacterium]|nr:FABP family protein [Ilumatobacteraceae bacterium]
MHESITPLAALLGRWRGDGPGAFPTIDSFDFTDEWEFSESGKPFIHFIEQTWDSAGNPKHTETGYLRCPTATTVEIVAALPTGQAECGTGTITGGGSTLTISIEAAVLNTPTAKHVERIVRRFELRGDELIYTMDMAAVGVPLTRHLNSTLYRIR